MLTITGSLSLAATFMLLLPPYRDRPELFPWGPPVVDMLLGWIAEEKVLAKVHAAAADWENRDRMQVEQFIMESLVVQRVGEQNRKGLVVPSGTVLMYYLQYWAARDAGVAARAHCHKLEAGSSSVRKNWMRAFRARWKVEHSFLLEPNSHDDDDEAILSKVPSRTAPLLSPPPQKKQQAFFLFGHKDLPQRPDARKTVKHIRKKIIWHIAGGCLLPVVALAHASGAGRQGFRDRQHG